MTIANADLSRKMVDALAVKSKNLSLILAGVTSLVGTLVALLLAYRISKPLIQTERRIVSLMEGDLTSPIVGDQRKDEIGQIAKAVSFFRDRLKERNASLEHERKIVASSIGKGLERLANRDLSYRLDHDLPEAYQSLQADFNRALDQLEAVMSAVNVATKKIASGTNDMFSASEELSRRTELQAASLEEATASIVDLTQGVNTSAAGANEARNFVTDTKKAAAECSNEMDKATAAIGRIASTSKHMTQIINTIDEIAFQTNLLALNAGVEAARAGDTGRGFAVVATEVRALAQRSADSAREISALIQTSLEETDQGVQLVGATRASLVSIIDRVGKLDMIMGDLAGTSIKQADDLKSVSSAVGTIDAAVQQNATMVGDTNTSTRLLADETSSLEVMIDSFIVKAKELSESGKTRYSRAA